MEQNQIFDLWLGNAEKIELKVPSKKTSIRSIRDFFLEQILQSYIKNFSLKDLKNAEHGKPTLESENLSFNLSHSGRYYSLLVCDQPYCGVDIQKIEKKHKFTEALKSVLTDNEFFQLELQGSDESFFQLWSLKEAYIKAIGSSIWFGRDYDFSEIIHDYSDKWVYSNDMYLYSFRVFPETFLTIAAPEKPSEMKIINF